MIRHFSASQTTIAAGQSVQLSWDLSAAEAAYLRYNGQEEGVISPGSKTVSPTRSTVYTLVAKNDDGSSSAEVTITVSGSPPAATSTPSPTATSANVTVAADNVSPTVTSASEPAISFGAAATTLPPGACTNLNWSVQAAETLFLDDQPVAGQGAREACPGQTQTYRLRAVYPGGEKLAEVTLTVTDSLLPPTDTPPPAATAIAGDKAGSSPATAVAVVVSPPARAGTPDGPRRFIVSTTSEDGESAGIWWASAVVVIVLGLFVVAPLVLIAAGGVAWWLKSRN